MVLFLFAGKIKSYALTFIDKYFFNLTKLLSELAEDDLIIQNHWKRDFASSRFLIHFLRISSVLVVIYLFFTFPQDDAFKLWVQSGGFFSKMPQKLSIYYYGIGIGFSVFLSTIIVEALIKLYIVLFKN